MGERRVGVTPPCAKICCHLGWEQKNTGVTSLCPESLTSASQGPFPSIHQTLGLKHEPQSGHGGKGTHHEDKLMVTPPEHLAGSHPDPFLASLLVPGCPCRGTLLSSGPFPGPYALPCLDSCPLSGSNSHHISPLNPSHSWSSSEHPPVLQLAPASVPLRGKQPLVDKPGPHCASLGDTCGDSPAGGTMRGMEQPGSPLAGGGGGAPEGKPHCEVH